MADDFNPADHTIAEVEAHLEENPQDAQRVLEAEKARGDDARSTLVSSLEERVNSTPELADPKPVTVAPAEAPGLLDQFEVTPERGYRKK